MVASSKHRRQKVTPDATRSASHVTPEAVDGARRLLARHFLETRLVFAETLSGVGRLTYLKVETELPTGSFKVRGAFYALATRSRTAPVKEVVTASTGNHGAAVAYAAQLLGIRATIFVPRGANPVKLDRITKLGARICEFGSTLAESIDEAAEYAAKDSFYFLHDASDPDVPVGAATIAREILDKLPAVDSIYVPVGDSALIRGVAAEAKRLHPSVRIIGVQAENAPAYYLSWRSGNVVVTDSANTIADGLATTRPLTENVAAVRQLVDQMLVVTEQDLLEAIRWLLFREHLVAEPAAAAATAAIMNDSTRSGTVVALVTGCNISAEVLKQAVAGLDA